VLQANAIEEEAFHHAIVTFYFFLSFVYIFSLVLRSKNLASGRQTKFHIGTKTTKLVIYIYIVTQISTYLLILLTKLLT
jgi:hypothetical protein